MTGTGWQPTVSAYDVHERGIQHVLDMIPDSGRYYIMDAFEPGIAPGVAAPCAGGITQAG